MNTPEIIELSLVEPGLKYPLVVEKLEALMPRRALIFDNNEDPELLHAQLAAGHGTAFRWEQLENGPLRWRVKIIKSPVYSGSETIGQILSHDYRKSRALSSLGVDFSCGGSQTMGHVFEGRSAELADVLQQWQNIDQLAPEKDMNFLTWDMAFLTNYIVQMHHRFVSTQTRFVTELAFKVADSNSTRNPEIKAVAELFSRTGKTMEMKDRKEEEALFPYIISLSAASIKGTRLKASEFGRVSVPIAQLQLECGNVVADLAKIRALTSNYQVPAYASESCPILYKLLAAYEADAHLHLHLENNILFPKAIETEVRCVQKIN